MIDKTLLLEKVQPSKIEDYDKAFYKLEFKANNERVYTVFVNKERELKLNDFFDLIKVDVYRTDDYAEFGIIQFLGHQGIYSYLTIEPNHTDPAKFNLIKTD